MYLLPSTPRTVNKWRMGRLAGLGCNCSERGVGVPPQKRMGQLGQVAGVPAGSVLGYSATWTREQWTATFIGWNDPNAVQSAIQGNLAAQWGIIIDAQSHSTSDYINTSGKSGFVLQVHTTSDYGAPGDIQQIIDGAIYAVGHVMPNSTIRVIQTVAPGAVPGGPAAAQIAAAQAGYADAIARGDQVSAAQFAKQIAQFGGQDPRGVVGWLSDNWQWLAAALGGVVAVKELV
jgi:hypothetical protein